MEEKFTDIEINEFMSIAIEQAKYAFDNDEVPVGALVIDQYGKIIAKKPNAMIGQNDPTAHAEISALREACQIMQTNRLDNCYLFTSLEPCAMCAGAIANARIKKIYIGAKDFKTGAVIDQMKIYDHPIIHHKPQFTFGILEEESSNLLKQFFAQKRK